MWSNFALAVVVAYAAAVAFYPALRFGHRCRTAAYLAASLIVILSPCLIPLTATSLRLFASLIAIALLVKLYDLYRVPQRALQMTFPSYLAYLPNWSWLVLRRQPAHPPVSQDLQRVARTLPAALVSMVVCVGLFRVDLSAVPFIFEHIVKVLAIFLVLVLISSIAAAVWRLLGGIGLDPTENVLAPRTPAEFWRGWNRPAQQFFHEYVFKPAGGHRRPVRATLITFAVSGLVHEYVFGIAAGFVQGWQILFFMLQGCAVAATMRTRPAGYATPLWVTGTLAFNLATSVLFFRSVDAVVPFYSPRDSKLTSEATDRVADVVAISVVKTDSRHIPTMPAWLTPANITCDENLFVLSKMDSELYHPESQWPVRQKADPPGRDVARKGRKAYSSILIAGDRHRLEKWKPPPLPKVRLQSKTSFVDQSADGLFLPNAFVTFVGHHCACPLEEIASMHPFDRWIAARKPVETLGRRWASRKHGQREILMPPQNRRH